MIRLPHLETNVTIACQNRCVGCNHFTPLQVPAFKASMLAPDELERDLDHFRRVAHVDAYAMIGGEPLLNPALVDVLRVARRSGVADRLEVWTNGQALREMEPEFWERFDVLVVTVYPGKLDDAELAWIAERCAAAGVRLEVKDERRFPNFTRLLEERETPPAVTAEKYRACWFRTYSRVLDRGWFYRCCTSPFIPKVLLGLPEGTDGLRVDEALTEERLRRFLEQTEPMAACGICAGRNTASATPLPWAEERDPERWKRRSAGLEAVA